MRRKILPFILGGALSIAAIAPAAAATCNPTSSGGGAAALIALVNANVSGVQINACDITVNALNNSLNNLLRNADVDVLSNILNNSPILNDSLNDLTVTVVALNDITLNDININVLGGSTDGITIVFP